jgi:hypothetical protein
VMVFHAASHPQWRDRTKTVSQSTKPRRIPQVSARPALRPHRGGTRHPVPASVAKG